MRVLFVSEYFPPKVMGGGEINLHLLAKALVKKGVDVNVLTSHHQGLKSYEEMDGVKVYRKLITGDNPRELLNNFKRSIIFPKSIMREVLRLEKEFDMIHFIGTSLIAAKKISSLGKPMFATIESYPTLCPKGDRIYYGRGECKFVCSFSKFLKCQFRSSEIGKMKNKFYFKYNLLFLLYVYLYYKKLNKSLNYCKLISISKYVRGLLKKHSYDSMNISNALDVSLFYSAKRKPAKLRIIYIGSLTKYKGPQVLIEALRGLDFRCDFYGCGVMEAELKQKIAEYKLDAEVHTEFVSYSEVIDRYANADIVVFPSIWPEPFGRISIEAMAASKPVVGSKIGGIAETIEEGILVKPGDVESLRAAIEYLAKDAKLRREMGRKGRKIAEEKYSEEKIVYKLIELYKSKWK